MSKQGYHNLRSIDNMPVKVATTRKKRPQPRASSAARAIAEPSLASSIQSSRGLRTISQMAVLAEKAAVKRDLEDPRWNRIALWWEGDERYYTGVVVGDRRGETPGEVMVRYDDGTLQSENLNKMSWKFVKLPNTLRSLPSTWDWVDILQRDPRRRGVKVWRRAYVIKEQTSGQRVCQFADGTLKVLDLASTPWTRVDDDAVIADGEKPSSGAVGRRTSRFDGVSWSSRKNKWRVFAPKKKGDTMKECIGHYDDEIVAARAYDDYIIANTIPNTEALNFAASASVESDDWKFCMKDKRAVNIPHHDATAGGAERGAASHGSSSRYCGVSKQGKKWHARITVGGELVTLGWFDNEVEGALACVTTSFSFSSPPPCPSCCFFLLST